MTQHTSQGHTFTIEQDEQDGTYTVVIDNRITCGGWFYHNSAFSYAQSRIRELIVIRH